MKIFKDDKEKKLYEIWIGMRRRCRNPNRDDYKYYGGRGIEVSKEWSDFNQFYKDMEGSYQKGLSIDRKDVNKGYEPNNCRWSTLFEQNNNRSNSLIFVVDGITASLSVLCRKYDIRHNTVLHRINSGWDIETALKTRPNYHNKYVGYAEVMVG